MDDIYMTPEAGRKLALFVLGGLLLFLCLIVYVGWESRQGRTDLKKSESRARTALTNASREACERGKKDRRANAQGWRTAQTARMQSVSKDLKISMREVLLLITHKPTLKDPPDLVAARRYNGIAIELEKRSKINCKEAFP